MRITIHHNKELTALRAIFVAAGFDLWLVGGVCRDLLSGREPKDIDLATSATPEEQVAMYEANGIRFVPTGLQHGTISVVMGETYEITSLRTETDHDGRRAKVAYTRDLNTDLGRRDLTINAMAWSFDGDLVDPFGGASDLAARRVSFVGNAEERMREDYLRILRFFRFHARFANDAPLDAAATAAINKTRGGLSQISVERIWSEMRRIIAGPSAISTLRQMMSLSLFEIIGMPFASFPNLAKARESGVTDPASLMGFYLPPEVVEPLAREWKWSREELDRAAFIATNKSSTAEGSFRSMLVDGIAFDWVADLMQFSDLSPDMLRNWVIPVFPLGGADLIEAGFRPGPEMGALLKRLRAEWKDRDFMPDREVLLKRAAVYHKMQA